MTFQLENDKIDTEKNKYFDEKYLFFQYFTLENSCQLKGAIEMSYGKHQSFYLRSNWLNKAFNAGDKFELDLYLDSTRFKDLGIGKNMFQSLRYWLEATNIIKISDKHITYTYFGELLHTYDRGINTALSLNLLHYYLCNLKDKDNVPISHTFHWYFNCFQDTLANKENLNHNLIIWNNNVDKKRISEKTISKDIDCLINTYTKGEKSHPEDKNVSILASLKLIEKINDSYVKVPIKEEKVDLDAFMYILLSMKESSEILNIESITNNVGGIGRVYNLNRVEIIEYIEKMSKLYPITITRTNNLDTISINTEITSIEFLTEAYHERSLRNEE